MSHKRQGTFHRHVRPEARGAWRGTRISLALAVGWTVAALCALAAGCSSSATSATSSTSTRPPATSGSSATSAPTAGNSGAAPFYQVRTGTVPGLGTVLVDGRGLTLYLFVPDRQSGTSTCYGACAQAWPPLLLPAGVSAPVAGPGVSPALLGTTHRSDGTTEVTYNKWPLYLWVNDSQPGQATGQGLNNLGGLWYVVSPAGHAITKHP